MVRKILLIDAEESKKPEIHMQWGHHPLGLLYIASYIKSKNPGIDIKIFHTLTCENVLSSLTDIMNSFKPDIIGVRAITRYKQQMYAITALIRSIAPNVHIVAGGPYPSASFHEVLADAKVDIVIIGEGEAVFQALVDFWNINSNIPINIPGTAVMDGDIVKINRMQSMLDVNTIPPPDYSLIDLSSYKHVYNQAFIPSNDCAYIFSSRGCPYQCIYCHNLFGKCTRRRTANDIVNEIKTHIREYGIKKFVFVDDIFNVPLEAGKKILKMISEECKGIKLYFPNGLRADSLDDEFIDLLKRTNTEQISLAVETSSNRLQKIIKKNLNVEKAKKYINIISKEFITTALFMVGFPTETYEEALNTIHLAEEFEYVSQPVLSILRVYENTPIYDSLNVSKEQSRLLKAQASLELAPKVFNNETHEFSFYGDYFSDDIVPLKSKKIKEIEYIWLKKVIYNKNRLYNSFQVISRYRQGEELINYYRLMLNNPSLSTNDLEGLIRKN